MLRVLWLVLPCVWASGACFRYVPVEFTAPRLADAVRVRLVEPRDIELFDRRARDVVQLDGEFVRVDDAELVLSVTDLLADGGEEYVARGESVRLPRDRIASLERKRISLPKTALMAGVVAAVIFGVDQALGGGGSERPPGGNGPLPR